MGIIFNIQKFCLHDGDGIRTCVFLKGCPLRCVWCHNPEGLEKKQPLSFDENKCGACGKCLEVCPVRKIENGVLRLEREGCISCGKCVGVCLNNANEIIGREISAAELLEDVLKDSMFYNTSGGGLTVTGGEPSYQPDFTLELLELSKNAGISIAMETCGAGSREFYKRAAELGTTFLYDIKCLDSVRHKEFTGADNRAIMNNLAYLMDTGADIIIRIPLVPDCNDSPEDIAALAELLNKNRGRYRYAEIMPYHTLGVGKAEKTGEQKGSTFKAATDEHIKRWCTLFEAHGTNIRVSK